MFRLESKGRKKTEPWFKEGSQARRLFCYSGEGQPFWVLRSFFADLSPVPKQTQLHAVLTTSKPSHHSFIHSFVHKRLF